tara:strand:+ start:2601 stop:2927 length:327 start_codon:yes stop_codon:yes gene_type:complete
MKIAFDLDDTVFTQGSPDNKYRDSVPKPEMIEMVNALYDEGHEIYFFSARHFQHYKYTTEVLKEAGAKYHGLVLNKISVHLFVDDRGFHWTDGKKEDLLKRIEGMKND